MDSDEAESFPAPEVPPVKRKPSKTKSTKKASQPRAAETEAGKNDGTNPHWAYKPPPGTLLADHDVDSGDFDWTSVQDDDDLELWLIRVPDGVNPKHLETLKIEQPSSTHNMRVGTLVRKHATFDIWSVAGDDDDNEVGGEEVKGLSCLLPRKRKQGKLYQAPKPIAHRFVVSAQAVRPTPDPSHGVRSGGGGALKYKNPPRHKYPKELLKHRFMPYGSQAPDDAAVLSVDADVEMANVDGEAVDNGVEIIPPPKDVETKPKEKKRKGHVTTSKVKKAKRTA